MTLRIKIDCKAHHTNDALGKLKDYTSKGLINHLELG